MQNVRFHRKTLFSHQVRFRSTPTGPLASKEPPEALGNREGQDSRVLLEILETREYQDHQGWDL